MTPATAPAWARRGLSASAFTCSRNIRGGGEFGPRGTRPRSRPTASVLTNDFIAIAEDLIKRRVTSTPHLGIMGGSNAAAHGCNVHAAPRSFWRGRLQVPLLDMKRYSHLLAGASWMAEYGNPDLPDEWTYISRYSPIKI